MSRARKKGVRTDVTSGRERRYRMAMAGNDAEWTARPFARPADYTAKSIDGGGEAQRRGDAVRSVVVCVWKNSLVPLLAGEEMAN